MKIYRTFEDAQKALLLLGDPNARISLDATGEVDNVKLTLANDSYDTIKQGGNIINFVGIGKTSSHGHPCSNFSFSNQTPFYRTRDSKKVFPVIIKDFFGLIYCIGIYEITEINKLVSDSGFSYYMITVKKVHAFSKKLMNSL
jgi:hypothetical protein